MKTIEEQYILNLIEKYEKKLNEYNEVSNDKQVKKYENLLYILNNLYNLVEDGYKYRSDK